MTTSTSGYLSLYPAWIPAATLAMAASTSAALQTRSEFSRKLQAVCKSGMSASPALEEAGKLLADFGVPQPILQRRFQVAQLAAAIVAGAGDAHGHYPFAREQRGDCVGELYLPAAARLRAGKQVENERGKHVAANHAQRRGRVLGRRFLN